MLKAYIAGPYRAETEYQRELNIRHAEEAMIRLMDKGWTVICPHMNTRNLGGRFTDRFILDCCLELVMASDLLYVLKGWETSEGTKEEIERATELEMSIIYEENDVD